MYHPRGLVAKLYVMLAFIINERAFEVTSVLPDHTCITCRLGLHVSGKLAADAVVVGADVVKTPACELLSAMELSTYKIFLFVIFVYL